MGGLFMASIAAYFVWISLFQLAMGQSSIGRLVFSPNFKGRIIPEDYWLRRNVNFSELSYSGDCGHQSYNLQPNSNVVLHSPNFPNLYPPNAHCLWKFQAPFVGQIKFIFTTFFMQIGKNSFTCNSDYLEITDWTGSTRFCASNEQRMPEASSRKGTTSCECGNVTQRVPRIIGGNRTSSSENPWMVSITDVNGNHLCSGTLVRYHFVLTAGHCVHGLSPGHARVVLGDDLSNVFQNENLRLIEIQEIVIYPGYNSQFGDLALVKIASYNIYEHAVLPICLPPADVTFENETAIAIGWHRQESGNGIQHYLHQVVVPVLDHATCQRAYGPQIISAEQMMCAGSVGKDACEGDSGGPLMWISDARRWHIIGIISFGVGCGLPGYPGVNVRLNHYLQWLQEKVGGESVC